MTTETKLTDEQVRDIIEDIAWPNEEIFKFAVKVARAIEQAMLQSTEIQELRKDAERYRYIRKGNQWIVAATQTGWHVDGGELDDLIDSELEGQK